MNNTAKKTNKHPRQTVHLDLKHGLRAWARNKNVRPSEFARAMGYTPAYAWSLLRGTASVTIPALGLFLLTYGAKEASELLSLSRNTQEEEHQNHTHSTLSKNNVE
jgi:hypothetical protein